MTEPLDNAGNEAYDAKFREMVERLFEPQKPLRPAAPQKKTPVDKKKEGAPALDVGGGGKKEMVEFATEKALEELEMLCDAFLAFQETICDLAVTQYLTPQIEYFAEQCQDMADLIENKIDPTKLSEENQKKFRELQKLRARVLASIYQKYKKDDKQGGNN